MSDVPSGGLRANARASANGSSGTTVFGACERVSVSTKVCNTLPWACGVWPLTE